MPAEPLQLAVIVGSVRDGWLGPTIAAWIADQARCRGDWNIHVIDLAGIDLSLAPPDFGSTPTPAAAQALQTLGKGRGVRRAHPRVQPQLSRLGPGYLSVGLTFTCGALPASIPSPPADFAETPLGAASLEAFLLDLRTAGPDPVRAWLQAPAAETPQNTCPADPSAAGSTSSHTTGG
ncbi:hypothetical protein ACIBHX_14010 [Nonomuraea sp. NPDC050536]|uniref:hypothetical protein n=1 Tax=Nonomuraea sp. NPDC050536 TaxID=3364366 RepID=UPI0037C64840